MCSDLWSGNKLNQDTESHLLNLNTGELNTGKEGLIVSSEKKLLITNLFRSPSRSALSDNIVVKHESKGITAKE